MKTSDFDYELPPQMIAQTPIEPRDSSRLLVLERATGAIGHRRFREIESLLRPGDLLVANDSRVIPARLLGRKQTGGQVEVFLLRQMDNRTWETLVRGKRVRPGTRIQIQRPAPPIRAASESSDHRARMHQLGNDDQRVAPLEATVLAETCVGGRVVEFDRPVEPLLEKLGVMPLPPYIHEPLADPERYQTVYSRVQGSVAAPTAGLHFTVPLIDRLQAAAVRFGFVTLHVGLDTFRPVKTNQIEDHPMHSEWGTLPAETAEAINETRRAGGRVIAVGTTAVRVLESAARLAEGDLAPWAGWTNLFIIPGHRFRVIDAMITNFHLPRSTLLMLVAALAGKPAIDRAYQEAISHGYRFYSFGDAMLIL